MEGEREGGKKGEKDEDAVGSRQNKSRERCQPEKRFLSLFPTLPPSLPLPHLRFRVPGKHGAMRDSVHVLDDLTEGLLLLLLLLVLLLLLLLLLQLACFFVVVVEITRAGA